MISKIMNSKVWGMYNRKFDSHLKNLRYVIGHYRFNGRYSKVAKEILLDTNTFSIYTSFKNIGILWQ